LEGGITVYALADDASDLAAGEVYLAVNQVEASSDRVMAHFKLVLVDDLHPLDETFKHLSSPPDLQNELRSFYFSFLVREGLNLVEA
jgi:hypothetical protein